MRIGVDVGGTNTDAVLIDANGLVVDRTKTPTTADVSTGIRNALGQLLRNRPATPISAAMLGTTQCTNAVVERRGLRRVSVLRLGAPATTAVPPFTDWPADLRAQVEGPVAIIAGGHEFTGKELSALDVEAVKRTADDAARAGLSIAVVGVFSAVNPDHEQRVAEVCARVAGPDHPVSLSREIGSIGFLERENATILNAALADIARVATTSFEEAVHAACGPARCYLTQNDGTLMALDYAVRYPSLILASGPANSMRGAAYLAGVSEGLVIDVGGTTTDIGILVRGFPREAPFAVEIGGVRTNFRMPDVVSLPLGGGTIVRQKGNQVRLGPDSVGFRLTDEALAFGGTVSTFTDAAIVLGRATLGDHSPAMSESTAAAAYAMAMDLVERGLERMRPSSAPIRTIAVGGGSVLLPDCMDDGLPLLRPSDFQVANAIGAAISEVSGGVDRILAIGSQNSQQLRAEVEHEAVANAVAAGADPTAVRIVVREEIPIAYLSGNAIRVRVKAAGPMAISE